MRPAPARAEGSDHRMGANVRANVIGNVVYAAGMWAQLVLFARFGGTAAVGSYAFALALTQPAMLLSQLQLRSLLCSDVRGAYAFREYRALRLATTAAALLALVPAGWATGQGGAPWPLLGAVALKAAADAVADIYLGLWQLHERMGLGAWMLSLNAVGSTALMAAAGLLGGGVASMAAGAALGSVLPLTVLHLRTAADPALRPALRAARAPRSWRRLLRLAREAAPLGVIVLLGSLQTNAPRYAVQRASGAAELGLFAAATQLTAAGALLIQALGGAAAPRLARAWVAGLHLAFRRLTRGLVLAAATLGVLGVATSLLVGRPVLAAVFGAQFGAAAPLLVVLSAAAGLGFVATLLGYALTAARVLVLQTWVLATALAVTAAGCAVLVPHLGAIGGAWALVGGSAIQVIGNAAGLQWSRRRGAEVAARASQTQNAAPSPTGLDAASSRSGELV